MKRFLSLILVAATLALSFVSGFEGLTLKSDAITIDYQCGDNATWDLDENGVLTISGTGDMYDYWPGSLHGDAPWNFFATSTKKIVIEEGITNINKNAFNRCYNATDIHIPSTVETIMISALPNTIERITVSENSMLREIHLNTLTQTKWFKSHPNNQPVYLGRMLCTYKSDSEQTEPDNSLILNIREGTFSISSSALRNKPIANITFPDSLCYIGQDAFYNTPWLNNQPTGPIYAGNVFVKYSGYIPLSENEYKLKEGTLGIAAYAFSYSDRITSIDIPESVRYIGDHAFFECINLEKVNFEPNSQLIHLGLAAFSGCEKLTAPKIPDSTEYIGGGFSGNTTEIHLPRNLKKIDGRFSCDTATKITIDPNNPYFHIDRDFAVYTKNKKTLIFTLYSVTLEEYLLLDECETIMDSAFSNGKIKKVILNQGLKYIGETAFRYSALESILIPKSVKHLDSHLFEHSELKNLVFENGIKHIDSASCRNISSITEIIFPDSVENIGIQAFENCTGLKKAVVPATTTIELHAFRDCNSLTIYCYKNSPAHEYATEENIPFVLIDEIKYTALKDAIKKAEELDRTLYTEDSLSVLDVAVSAVNLDAENLTLKTIDAWCEAIEKALSKLVYKNAVLTPTFYVPEVIFMGSDTTTKYFYGVNEDGSVTKDLSLSEAASGALVYWNLPGARSVTINARLSSSYFTTTEPDNTQTIDDGIASITVGESKTMTGTDTFSGKLSALTLSQSVPVGTYRFIEWTADYTANGMSYTQYAYTIVANTLCEYTAFSHCANKVSGHQDSFSEITLVIGGVTSGANASATESDATSCTATGSANIVYDNTRFSSYSAYPLLTSYYTGFSYQTMGRAYIYNATNVPSATAGSIEKSVPSAQITSNGALSSKLTVEIVAHCNYKSQVADATSRFYITGTGINKSQLRSDYQTVIKTQKYSAWCDEETFSQYKLAILKMAAKLAAPGSTDTSATLPDDSGFNPDNNNIEDSNLKDAINRAEEIDRTLYTDDSLSKLDAAVSAVNLDADDLTQEMVNAWCEAIEKALSDLVYKNADYTRINTLKETADKLDRSLYTTDSLSALDAAFSAVEYNLSVDKQSQVDLWAEAIEDALQNLEYLPADYSAVEEALETAQKIDRRYYSQISLIRLDNAVNAVDYTLNILEQERVNSFAKAITDALNALEYASVVLRHEECGVIVSATAKEIKPETLLAVEEVDPSNYEGTNFAVGGSIRSLHFYDINLLYNAVIVQPDGTVTVKIRLKDGVDPNKCKVYHVTEDIVNPLVRFANTIDGNYIVFETDHFSEFAVIEVETVVDRIEISSLPIKTEYGIGEVLDLSGMKVTAYYSNGTDKVIDDYNVGLVTLDSIGTKVVTVYYTFGNITKTAEFTVTVTVEKSTVDILENDSSVSFVHKKLGFFSLYTKASIQLGINLDLPDEFTVRWSSDNKKVLVDENGKVTCKGLIGAKKANITVEILDKDGKVISSDTVSVIFYKLSIQLSMLVSKAVDIYKKSIVQY